MAKGAGAKTGKSAAEAAKKKAAADAKAKAAAEARFKQMKEDQAWLDDQLKDKSSGYKEAVFRELSQKCPATTMNDGHVVLGCPIKPRMIYCVPAKGKGAELSSNVTDALSKKNMNIDANFVSKEEGGSYREPYVPWGPISGKNGKPVLTQGNNSGATVGTGVDLGQISDPDAYLKRLEQKGVSAATRDKIKPLLGKTKENACAALRAAQPMQLDPHDVELIDTDAMEQHADALKKSFNAKRNKQIAGLKKEIAKEGKRAHPDQGKIDKMNKQIDNTRDFDQLSGREQSILMSTEYHEGSINRGASGKFTEAVLSGDQDAEKTALEAKSTAKNPLIAQRGKEELGYFNNHPDTPSPSAGAPGSAGGATAQPVPAM
jgi:hypothetical protein